MSTNTLRNGKEKLKPICKIRNSNEVVHYAIHITFPRIDIKSECLFFLQYLKKVKNIHYDIWINETTTADPSLTSLIHKVFNFTQATCFKSEKALINISPILFGKNMKKLVHRMLSKQLRSQLS